MKTARILINICYLGVLLSLVIATRLRAQTIQNSGFESPFVGSVGEYYSFEYDPTEAGWTFTGNAGIAANGSGFAFYNPGTPYGNQFAFLQYYQGSGGSMSQTISNFSSGKYTFTFMASQRATVGTDNTMNQGGSVSVDGTNVGSFTPFDTNWYYFQTSPISLNAGNHVLTFATLLDATDATVRVDMVGLEAGSETQIYDAVNDFSITNGNPNNSWSYGILSSFTDGTFTLLTNEVSNLGFPGEIRWNNDTSQPYSVQIFANPTGIPTTFGSILAPTNQLDLDGQSYIADVRWAAPFTGSFNVMGLFQRNDNYGVPVSVRVIEDGTTELFGLDNFTDYLGQQPFNLTNLALPAGTVLDFAEGAPQFYNDTTGLKVTIVASGPAVQYVATPINGSVPLTVQFTSSGLDSSGNPVTNWNWNFGDGTTSTAKSPSHIYATSGTFSPILIAANDLGDMVPGFGPTISVSLPIIQYDASPTNGIEPLTVQFTSPGVDSGGNPITQWNWSFGDGSASALQNPTHTYTTEGSFLPSLVATNSLGMTVAASGPSIDVEFNSGLVPNGDFGTGDFTSWTLSGDNIYTFVDDGTYSGITPYLGTYEADLGADGSLGYLSQTLATTTGKSYQLSFWINDYYGYPNTFIVSWNDSPLFAQTNAVFAEDWTNIQLLVTATTNNSVLQFGFEDDYDYLGLDDISVIPLPRTEIASISVSGTNLQLGAINGLSGTTNYLLMGTNLTQPIDQWTRISTNVLNTSGSFTITATNAVNLNAGKRFYILEMQ
jgi:PKD repeat protein